MLTASVVLANCRRIVLAILGCLTLLGTPASVEAHGEGPEPDQARVVRSFFHALCERDGMTALALLTPGAPVMHTSWIADLQGHRLETFSLNRPGSERAMFLYFRDSACLPIEHLQVREDLVTWQRTLWRDADSTRNGEETLRWHYRVRVEDQQIAELLLAVEVPHHGLPPPSFAVATAKGTTQAATVAQRMRDLQASVKPVAPPARPPVSISVGPTEAAWPVIVLGATGVVLLIGLGGRRRVRARPASLTRSTTCIWLSVGLCSALLLSVASPVQAHGHVEEAVPVVQALHRALGTQDDHAALALFHADAVIEIEGPSGQELYASSGPDSLLDGIRKLAESRPSLDLATAQVSGVTFSGAPATRVLCAYRGSPGPLHLPPERGQADLRIQSGRIVYYTRKPDFRSLSAREAAWSAANSAFGTRMAAATAAAASGIYNRTPNTQERTSPAVGKVIAIVAIPLAVVVMLAMFTRPNNPA